MRRVSNVNGTPGHNSDGSPWGSLPSSPTVGTATAKAEVTIVSNTIATSGAGTAAVRRGK